MGGFAENWTPPVRLWMDGPAMAGTNACLGRDVSETVGCGRVGTGVGAAASNAVVAHSSRRALCQAQDARAGC